MKLYYQEFLQLLGPVYGGSVFSYSSRDQVCYILDSGDRECSSVSGPRQPSISDCTTTTTTATTTTTTATITTTTKMTTTITTPSETGEVHGT